MAYSTANREDQKQCVKTNVSFLRTTIAVDGKSGDGEIENPAFQCSETVLTPSEFAERPRVKTRRSTHLKFLRLCHLQQPAVSIGQFHVQYFFAIRLKQRRTRYQDKYSPGTGNRNI